MLHTLEQTQYSIRHAYDKYDKYEKAYIYTKYYTYAKYTNIKNMKHDMKQSYVILYNVA